tara:strand:+ start:1999 stop:2202 length:204 start_codon:yes stop_codon:yes gene_type:complete
MIHPEEFEKKLEDFIQGKISASDMMKESQTANYTPEGIINYLIETPIEDDKLAEACSKAVEDYYNKE